VAGKTLREVLADGPLPTKRLLKITTQMADGLAKPLPTAPAYLAYAYAVAGRTGEAHEILQELEGDNVSEGHIAFVYAGLGEKDDALDWLNSRRLVEVSSSVFGCKPIFTVDRQLPIEATTQAFV
jgi:hypothetical protein